jgi:hypothetical protein
MSGQDKANAYVLSAIRYPQSAIGYLLSAIRDRTLALFR